MSSPLASVSNSLNFHMLPLECCYWHHAEHQLHSKSVSAIIHVNFRTWLDTVRTTPYPKKNGSKLSLASSAQNRSSIQMVPDPTFLINLPFVQHFDGAFSSEGSHLLIVSVISRTARILTGNRSTLQRRRVPRYWKIFRNLTFLDRFQGLSCDSGWQLASGL